MSGGAAHYSGECRCSSACSDGPARLGGGFASGTVQGLGDWAAHQVRTRRACRITVRPSYTFEILY
jgi:hypothetical protein